MSFFYKPYKQKIIQKSLQNNFMQARAKKTNKISIILTRKGFCKKRAFCSAPLPGLMTVEAAIVLPVFLLAVLSLLNFIHMVGTNEAVFTAMAKVIHPTAIYGYSQDFKDDSMYPLILFQLASGNIASEHIWGGLAGINYQGSQYNADTGEIVLAVAYQLKPAFSMFRQGTARASMAVYSRAYIGGKMLTDDALASGKEKMTVYIAQNGVVYHKDRSCAYIDVSFHAVHTSGVGDLRNSDGAKYYPCELCQAQSGEGGTVYITDSGNRYHSTTGCSGLKRTVYTMELDGDCILPGCSRCAR